MPGPLVHHLDLPPLAPPGDGPLAPAGGLEGQPLGAAVQHELPDGRARHHVQGGAELPAVHGHPVAVHQHLDLLARDGHDVLHEARSSRATVST